MRPCFIAEKSRAHTARNIRLGAQETGSKKEAVVLPQESLQTMLMDNSRRVSLLHQAEFRASHISLNCLTTSVKRQPHHITAIDIHQLPLSYCIVICRSLKKIRLDLLKPLKLKIMRLLLSTISDFCLSCLRQLLTVGCQRERDFILSFQNTGRPDEGSLFLGLIEASMIWKEICDKLDRSELNRSQHYTNICTSIFTE